MSALSNFGPYPGYWTELVILHDWPPRWEPQEWQEKHDQKRESAVRGRETALARGHTGTIVGLSRQADDGSAAYYAIKSAKAKRSRT